MLFKKSKEISRLNIENKLLLELNSGLVAKMAGSDSDNAVNRKKDIAVALESLDFMLRYGNLRIDLHRSALSAFKELSGYDWSATVSG